MKCKILLEKMEGQFVFHFLGEQDTDSINVYFMGDLADRSGVIDVGVRISVTLSHPILKWSMPFICLCLTP